MRKDGEIYMMKYTFPLAEKKRELFGRNIHEGAQLVE